MKHAKDIAIVIADDHPMLLKGLDDELAENGYNVVASADNGKKALEALLAHKPALAFLDIDMPGLTGFEVVSEARKQGLDTKFIMLSFHKEPAYIMQAKTLQIQGYLLKEDSFSEIERCIEHVMNNRECFSASFENKALLHADEEHSRLSMLTPSETTILKYIVANMETQTIADELSVSVRTVEKHRSNIISKLSLPQGTNALVKWAITNKNIILQL